MKLLSKLPKLTLKKEVTLIVAFVVLALGLFSWSVVRYEQNRKTEQASLASREAALKASQTATANYQASLNSKIVTLTEEKTALCNLVVAYQKVKTPIIPPVCTAKQ